MAGNYHSQMLGHCDLRVTTVPWLARLREAEEIEECGAPSCLNPLHLHMTEEIYLYDHMIIILTIILTIYI